MKNSILLFSMVLMFTSGFCQNSLDFPEYGVRLKLPSSWDATEQAESLVLISQLFQAYIFIIPTNSRSSDSWKREVLSGASDEGIYNIVTHNEAIENGIFYLELQGYLQAERIEIIAYCKPRESNTSVSAFALYPVGTQSREVKTDLEGIMNSIVYYTPELPPEPKVVQNADWYSLLVNHRLTYLNSYSSNSFGSASGSSTEYQFDLCDTYFNYSGNSSLSIDTEGAYGYQNSDQNGSGTWEVKGNTLYLNYYDGKQETYSLKLKSKKLFLNGNRYFRTNSGEYAPNCK